jgi:2-haloacid dehalogenase
MQGYLELKAWPDALAALNGLKASGLRMAFLSNFTAAMLDQAVKNSGLEGIFDDHLSTDRVRAFKPDPRAYRMAMKCLQVEERRDRFCCVWGLGCGRGRVVRLSYFLGESRTCCGRRA